VLVTHTSVTINTIFTGRQLLGINGTGFYRSDAKQECQSTEGNSKQLTLTSELVLFLFIY